MAPLNWSGSGSRGRWCGLAHCHGEVSNRFRICKLFVTISRRYFLECLMAVPLNEHSNDGLSSKVLSHASHFRRWCLLMAVQRELHRRPLHGLLERPCATGSPNVPIIITEGLLYHGKSFHCGLAKFHTKLHGNPLFQGALHCGLHGRQKRVSLKCLLSLSGSSERTKRPRVHKLTSPSTDPNRSERAAMYSHFTIKSLTLLFGQNLYIVFSVFLFIFLLLVGWD